MPHTITIQTKDNLGNINNTNVSNTGLTLRFNLPPSVTIFSPSGETHDANKEVYISANVSDAIDGIGYSIAQVILPNGSTRNVSMDYSLNQPNDNFNSYVAENWATESIVGPGQACVADIDSTAAGKAYGHLDSDGSPITDAYCSLISKKVLDGDFDINVSFQILGTANEDFSANLELLEYPTANSTKRISFILGDLCG